MELQPGITQTIPFFIVTDMERSLRFYVEGLGFSVTNTWTPHGTIEWCALKRDAVTLMLQQPHNPEHHPAWPDKKTGLGVSIVFICADALAIYQEAIDRNVPVAEPFVGNTMWVVSFSDPDGYRLDFESSTDVPEETTYAEWKNRN